MKENRQVVYDIYEKITGKSGLEWADICEKNGLACHPDTLRKAGLGIKMAADAGVIDFSEDDTQSEYDRLYVAKKKILRSAQGV